MAESKWNLDDERKAVEDELRKRIKLSGLTMKEVGKRCDLLQNDIAYKIKSGNIPYLYVKRIAEVLGYELEWKKVRDIQLPPKYPSWQELMAKYKDE